MSEDESVDAALYTQEEMNAVVEEARMWGRKVAAHAHGTEGIERAIRAGVASVDHGTFLDEEAARMMAGRGTYLVKDSYEVRWFLEQAPGWSCFKGHRRQARQGRAGTRGGVRAGEEVRRENRLRIATRRGLGAAERFTAGNVARPK